MDPNTNLLMEEYAKGIIEFMTFVQQQPKANTGFMSNYKFWYLHGETTGYEYGSSSETQTVDRLEEPRTEVDHGVGTEQMVNDHYRGEEPNVEARKFFDMLEAGK
ncbi:hypothetical protein YC2023_044811 [Brassica napus]